MMNGLRFGVAAVSLTILGAILGSSVAAQQKPLDVMPPKLVYTVHTLSNGLQVIFLEDHAIPVINLQIWYHVGSKDEQPGHTG